MLETLRLALAFGKLSHFPYQQVLMVRLPGFKTHLALNETKKAALQNKPKNRRESRLHAMLITSDATSATFIIHHTKAATSWS